MDLTVRASRAGCSGEAGVDRWSTMSMASWAGRGRAWPRDGGDDFEGFEAAIDHDMLQGSAPGQRKGEACRGFRSWHNRRRSSIGDGGLSSDGFIRRLGPPAQLRVGVEDLCSSTVVSLSRKGFYHRPIPPTLADALSIALRACPNRPPGWLQSVLPRLVMAQGPDSYRVCGLPRRP